MKTNIVMKSEKSRELFGIVIRQETKNRMLSLTDLQNAYSNAKTKFGWSEKRISNILNNKGNIERIYYLLCEQKLIKTGIPAFMELVEKQGITTVLKSLNVYKTSGRGDNKQTLCDPYIWMLVALELNPMLYAKVVTWITDGLIINRIEACDLNNSLRSELALNIPNPNYSAINTALNIKIFGHHQTGMRNLASTEELASLSKLEGEIACCIKRGFLKTNQDVLQEIKR